MRKPIVVIEANEVPFRLWHHYIDKHPGSTLAKIFKASLALTTIASDIDEEQLYPSQTWASQNMGVPYAQHEVYWYNDPKPARTELYWNIALKSGLTVGLVNPLHSAATASFTHNDRLKYFLPDSFASDCGTKPEYLKHIHSFNVAKTQENRRVARIRLRASDFAASVSAIRAGLTTGTFTQTISACAQIAFDPSKVERLRTVQFGLLSDIFLKQFAEVPVDLALLHTNHIASQMHRYWCRMFPGDFPAKQFAEGWINAGPDEVSLAVDRLDQWLARLLPALLARDAILVIASSMGQRARIPTEKPAASQSILSDVAKFAAVNRCGLPFKLRPAMAPQYILEFASGADAQFAEACFHRPRSGHWTGTWRKDNVLTISFGLETEQDHIEIDGMTVSLADAGIGQFTLSDCQTGEHCRQGSLVIFNSKTANATSREVDYLEYAPAMLQALGVEPPAYMQPPTFSF